LNTEKPEPLGRPFEPGHQTNLQHGGAAARKALTTQAEFTGPARQAELAVRDELYVNGRLSVVERAAVRLQAASDLYWGALCDAGERGDVKSVNSHAKTFGWLQSKALAAWQQLKLEMADQDDGSIEAAITAAKDKAE
jgi:hypothetical protein